MTATLTDVKIRPFDEASDADYEAYARIRTSILPDHASTAAELRDFDARRDPRCKDARWLAERDGRALGFAGYSQQSWSFHPRRFHLMAAVLPEEQGRGVGSALYDTLRTGLEPFQPVALLTQIREDWERSDRFAAARGFREMEREFESRLNVAAFDPAPWADASRKAVENGIVIRTLRELLAEDPEAGRKVWETESEAFRDIPVLMPLDAPPFDVFEKKVLQSPNLLPDAFFVAVDAATGEWAGTSALWSRDSDDRLQTGFTGVRRKFRRKGIALALKLRAIEYARSVGCPVVVTENATTNRPMLSINEALGFVKEPAWVVLVNEIEPGGATERWAG